MESNQYKTVIRAGEYGEVNCAACDITLDGAAIGTRIEWVKLPPGTELLEVKRNNDALNADTTLGVGELFDSAEDGTTAAASLVSATSTASAGQAGSSFHPKRYNVPVTITSTVAGAEADGKVSVLVYYRYIGPM